MGRSIQCRASSIFCAGDRSHSHGRRSPFWILPQLPFRSGDADFLECGVRKRNLCRTGTFQPNSQRNTLTVSQYHPLCAFTALGFADCGAPFLAGAKLPSRKASSHRSSPSASRVPKHARLDAHGRPRLSFRRRGLGNSGSINSHCSSVNSFCRFLMADDQQLARLTSKSPL